MMNHMERFHQYAVQQQLSSTAILLWQQLYFSMHRKGTASGVAMSTSYLLASLQISRKGLYNARQSLVDAGLLQVDMEHQTLYYTLQINGQTLEFEPKQAGQQQSEQPLSARAQQALSNPLQQPEALTVTAEQTAEDLDLAVMDFAAPSVQTFNSIKMIQQAESITAWQPLTAEQLPPEQEDGLYQPLTMEDYTEIFAQFTDCYYMPTLSYQLQNWAKMRLSNGWKLTRWGLQTLLDKLVQLSRGDLEHMADIVKQSIARRWKGFHPLSVKQQPSGERLVKQEAKEEQKQRQEIRQLGGVVSKFDSNHVDLSFLEE